VTVSQKTILLVEGNSPSRNKTSELLRQFGYSVITAKDGKHALQIFNNSHNQIDLAILDLLMPEISGPDAYIEMRMLKPSLPVIFIAGGEPDSGPSHVHEWNGGFITILQKPLTRRQLAEKLDNLFCKPSPTLHN